MKTTRSRSNLIPRRRSQRVAISPRSNATKATDKDGSGALEAALDADDDGAGDDELSDEEQEKTVEVKTDEASLDSSLSAPVQPIPAAADGIPEEFITEEIDDDDDLGALVYFMDDAKHNNFFAALINAVEAYSTKLRVPAISSMPSETPEARPAITSPRPELLGEIESDSSEDSDGEKEEASADASGDAVTLSDEARINVKEAAELFYLPSSPWAEFANTPIESPTIISRLYEGSNCQAFIKQGRLGGNSITYISRTWNFAQKWEGFFSEMALYSDPDYLRPLQGEVVPKIIGVYLSDISISIAMELPSSDFWIEASEAMSEELKSRCIAAFDKIHDRGVLHNDIELRHMLINSKGEVIIIDFQESRALKPRGEVGLQRATEADIRMEKRKIRFKLGFKDSRLQESLKVKRVALNEELKERQGYNGRLAKASDDKHKSGEQTDDLDPPVDASAFNMKWVDELTTCRCYIVPGQSKIRVGAVIEEFLLEEVARLKRDGAYEMNEKDDAEAECSSFVSSAATVSSTATRASISPVASPILPTRINLKRGRDDSDEESDNSHLGKKQRAIEAGKAPMSLAPPSVYLPPIPSTSLYVRKTPDPSSFMGDGKALVSDIHVPFEGYTESDGFILRNAYADRDVTAFRKKWVRRDSIKRSVEENLPYPVAEVYNLVPKTLPKVIEYDKDGNVKRKKRPLLSLGALKRAHMSLEEHKEREDEAEKRMNEYLRNRRQSGTGLSDIAGKLWSLLPFRRQDVVTDKPSTSDRIPEGPRILSWHELDGLPLDPVYCPDPWPNSASSAPPMSASKPKTPSKSVLRRRLTFEEKTRNVEYLKAKRRLDGDLDDDGDLSTDYKKHPKRICVDEVSVRSQDSPSSDRKPEGSASSRRSSSCGVPIPYPSLPPSAQASPPTNRPRSLSPFHRQGPDVTSSSAGFLPFSQPASPVSLLLGGGTSGPSDSDKGPPSSAPSTFCRYSLPSHETPPDSDADRSNEPSGADKSNIRPGLERKPPGESRLDLSLGWF